jgi:hypothetical protein
MHDRIAHALGWTVAQSQSFSLAALRDLVRPVDAALADEISDTIRRGDYIRGAPYVGTRKVVVYVHRGTVERYRNGRCGIYEAYSETSAQGGTLYPWMTYRECQADARARGVVARFSKPTHSRRTP